MLGQGTLSGRGFSRPRGPLISAGNIPTSFQKLGTAVLAGYGADSATRAALSKLPLGKQEKQAASG